MKLNDMKLQRSESIQEKKWHGQSPEAEIEMFVIE